MDSPSKQGLSPLCKALGPCTASPSHGPKTKAPQVAFPLGHGNSVPLSPDHSSRSLDALAFQHRCPMLPLESLRPQKLLPQAS